MNKKRFVPGTLVVTYCDYTLWTTDPVSSMPAKTVGWTPEGVFGVVVASYSKDNLRSVLLLFSNGQFGWCDHGQFNEFWVPS